MEQRIQIGDEVLLVVDINADWYISGAGYDGESVDITLRRKADKGKDWWRLIDTPQTERNE